MCIGIPVRIIRRTGLRAHCEDRHGRPVELDLMLVGPQAPGVWVMSFKGSARELMDAEAAARVGAALDALQALAEGDAAEVDLAFADLVGREPELPDFLRGTARPGTS